MSLEKKATVFPQIKFKYIINIVSVEIVLNKKPKFIKDNLKIDDIEGTRPKKVGNLILRNKFNYSLIYEDIYNWLCFDTISIMMKLLGVLIKACLFGKGNCELEKYDSM